MQGNTTLNYWQQGFGLFFSKFKQSLGISLPLVVAPNMLFLLYLSSASQDLLVSIQNSVGQSVSPVGALVSASQMSSGFLGEFILGVIFCWVLSIWAIFSLHRLYFFSDKSVAVKECLKLAIKDILPGLWFSILVATLFVLSLSVFPPFFYWVMITMMAPILWLDRGGSLASHLFNSLSMGYAKKMSLRKFPLAFQLITIGCLFYAAVILGNTLLTLTAHFDSFLPVSRGFFTQPFLGFSFTVNYLLISVLRMVWICVLLAALPALTTTLYKKLEEFRQPTPA